MLNVPAGSVARLVTDRRWSRGQVHTGDGTSGAMPASRIQARVAEIQARIAEIQARIASLQPNDACEPGGPGSGFQPPRSVWRR